MLNCSEIARLVSESHDRNLPFRYRLEVRLHLMMCAMCRAFSKQITFLRRLTRRMGSEELLDGDRFDRTLSPEAKSRLKAAISREMS